MNITIINGMAGTGKSTYVSNIINRLQNKKIYVLAFTHSAVENIKKMINNNSVKCKTLHSFFRINPMGGMQGIYKDFDYIFIDEYTLVDKSLLNSCIINASSNKNIPWNLYLIGDFLQLGSIKNKDENIPISELYKYENIFNSEYSFNAKINVIRHINGIYSNEFAKIITLSHNYRNNDKVQSLIKNIVFDTNFIYSEQYFIKSEDEILRLINNGYVFISSTYKQLQKIMLKMSKNSDIIINQNIPFSIGYKNLCLQENMIIYTTINTENFHNGEEFIFIRYDGDILHCMNLNGENIEIQRDKEFSYFPVSPSYLLTIHKSQGKSIDNVILSVDNLFEFPMLYTGISRAKNNILLYTENYNDKLSSFNHIHSESMMLLYDFICNK